MGTKKTSAKKQEPIIHINAQSKFLCIMEQVNESDAVRRLTEIKDAFARRSDRWAEDKLVVKTVKVNPTMF